MRDLTTCISESSFSLLFVDATEKSVLGFLYDPEKTFFHVRVTLKNAPVCWETSSKGWLT